jgi:phosphoribosyl 1,2-cyclic phosphodiesterase
MELQILSTGSGGNSYHLKPKSGNGILIDCGIAYKEIQRNIDLTSIDGVLLGHSHSDHSKACKDILKRGFPIYMADETKLELKIDNHNAKRIFAKNGFKVGNFKVLPFDLHHDVYCLGFLINHPEMGNLLFMTDTTHCKYRFNDINHFLIEANFCEDIIDQNSDKDFLTSRIYKSHMSIQNCVKFLQANDLSKTDSITLIHLSDRNSHAKQFKEKVQKATGKRVEIAKNGLVINF